MKPYLVTIECETGDVTWLERSIIYSESIPDEKKIIRDMVVEFLGDFEEDKKVVDQYISARNQFVTDDMTQKVYRIEEITVSDADVLTRLGITQ